MFNHKIQLYQNMTDGWNCIRMYSSFVLDCLFLILYSILYAYPFELLQCANPFRWKSLKDEIILVTGSGDGIGREIALRLAKMEKCCTIICWDEKSSNNNTLVEQLRSLGVKKVVGFGIEVSDQSQVKAAADKIRKDIGDVTILINNAGISSDTMPLWKQSPEQIERVLAVNLKSHMWTLREFLPAMIKKDKGHVVTNCSIFGLVHSKKASVYAAAMHALHGCIESVKQDIMSSRASIHFTTVYPHATATHLIQHSSFKSKYPFLLPLMEPEKVAEKIIYGMRRCEENIYIPFHSRLSVLLKNILLPSVFRKTLNVVEYDVVALNPETERHSRFYC